MSRYLVTGCAGFIASRVCQMLLAEGHEVLGVDELNDAYDPRLKQWRLQQLERESQFRFFRLDIADRQPVEDFFRKVVCDLAHRHEEAEPLAAVINLAARAGVRASVENPWVYYRTNCDGTLNLLDLCRRYGVRKFILASTSSLYGAHNPIPYREEADTSRPLSPYAASKKAAETLAYTYHHLYGLDVTVLRYFTVYGPAGRPDMSVFRFVRCIAEDEPIVVFGDGKQSRDFTFVDDIARGTLAALKPLGYQVINLGSDRPFVLRELIERIGELLGRSAQIVHRPRHPADVLATWADITKARQLLDWQPQIPLEEGLQRCVHWYLENREFVRQLDLGPW